MNTASPPPFPIDIDLFAHAGNLKVKREDTGTNRVWCPIRRAWFALLPEEIVRQAVLQYLLVDRKITRGRIAVEKGFNVRGRLRRFDIVVFDRTGAPLLLVECKSPSTPIRQSLFNQLSTYNQVLRAKWLWATNGPTSFLCTITPQSAIRYCSTFPPL